MPIFRHINSGAVFADRLGDLADLRRRYTVTGAPIISASPFGNVLNCNGAGYVTLGLAEEHALRFDSGAQDFSISMRVRRTAIVGNEVILDKRDGGNDGYFLYFTAAQLCGFFLNAFNVGTTSLIDDTEWHHIAVVVDRSASIQMYLDGAADGAPRAIAGPVMATTANPRIGNSFTDGNTLNGEIYAVVIFDRILTPAEVLDLATHKAF